MVLLGGRQLRLGRRLLAGVRCLRLSSCVDCVGVVCVVGLVSSHRFSSIPCGRFGLAPPIRFASIPSVRVPSQAQRGALSGGRARVRAGAARRRKASRLDNVRARPEKQWWHHPVSYLAHAGPYRRFAYSSNIKKKPTGGHSFHLMDIGRPTRAQIAEQSWENVLVTNRPLMQKQYFLMRFCGIFVYA